jgi:hypothetical protein
MTRKRCSRAKRSAAKRPGFYRLFVSSRHEPVDSLPRTDLYSLRQGPIGQSENYLGLNLGLQRPLTATGKVPVNLPYLTRILPSGDYFGLGTCSHKPCEMCAC